MRKFVERLHDAGVRMAVASGSSREAIEAILSGAGLTMLLPVVVSADEVAHGKPAPAQADDPRFATAGLLFRGGQDAFTARAAIEWLALTPTTPS